MKLFNQLVEREQIDRMLALTGRRPNLIYLGDDAAIALGVDEKDLDALRDDAGIVVINADRDYS